MKKLSLSVLVLSFVSASALAQSAVQKGISNNPSPRISMNVTVAKQQNNARQTPNTSFGQKVNAVKQTANQAADDHRTYTGGRKLETIALVNGQPIGGIVVKGGQNPRPR
ncbi:hypothetical protein EWM62_07710 [Mucilaginibacter terrigena]|uniref:TonB-dependent receptor plug domain-containing protein n=1 Tax=Mucilaginibacter terrigena TaxID=2492395 RepID=A0A4Q5LMT5_9SPHI|nr:hypothetical protein [Mucilaginibacter terrigena]RYU90533.1 hypothetical protein EWM62_07710 [Mucilaginibacter terrigena]